MKKNIECCTRVILESGHRFYVHGESLSLISTILEKYGITDFELQATAKPPAGFFKIWAVGELIDYINEEKNK
jgi:hypothetical protein